MEEEKGKVEGKSLARIIGISVFRMLYFLFIYIFVILIKIFIDNGAFVMTITQACLFVVFLPGG